MPLCLLAGAVQVNEPVIVKFVVPTLLILKPAGVRVIGLPDPYTGIESLEDRVKDEAVIAARSAFMEVSEASQSTLFVLVI